MADTTGAPTARPPIPPRRPVASQPPTVPQPPAAAVAVAPVPPIASGILRVHWLPGTDQLLGTCHCGAEHTALDPVELWDWLLGHPVGHRGGAADDGSGPGPEPESAPEFELEPERELKPESRSPWRAEPPAIRILTLP